MGAKGSVGRLPEKVSLNLEPRELEREQDQPARGDVVVSIILQAEDVQCAGGRYEVAQAAQGHSQTTGAGPAGAGLQGLLGPLRTYT